MNDHTVAPATGLSTPDAQRTKPRGMSIMVLAVLAGSVLVTANLLLQRGSSEPLSGLALTVLFAGLFIILGASYQTCRIRTSCLLVDAVQVVVVLIITAAAYVHAAGVGFLADDFNFLGPTSWQRLASSFFPVGERSFYRPLEQVLWAADYYLSGRNPTGYHVTNGLLLALSAGLVYVLAVLMLRHRFAAIVAALLYGLHPLHVQATVWIAGRPSLLVTVFFVLAVICYVLGQQRPRMRWISWLAAALALMSKESAATLPAVIALTYFVRAPWPGRSPMIASSTPVHAAATAASFSRPTWRPWLTGLLRDVAPYVALLAAYLIFRVVVIGELRPFYHGSYGDWPAVSNNLATAIKMLGIPWTRPEQPAQFVTSNAWVWILAYAGLTILAMTWSRARLLFWGMSWFLITYSPLVNVQFVQERFFDLPLVGIAMAAPAALLLLGDSVALKDRRVGMAAVALGVLLASSVVTVYVQAIRARTEVYYQASDMIVGPAEQIKSWYPDLPAYAHITVLGVPSSIGDYFNLAYSWGLGRQLQALYPPTGPSINVYSHRDIASLAASRPLSAEDYFFLYRPDGQIVDLSPDVAPHHIRFVASQDDPSQPSYQRLSTGETLTVSLLLDPAVTDTVWLRYRGWGGSRVGLQAQNLRGQCQIDWPTTSEGWMEQRLVLPRTIEQGWQVTLTVSNLGPAGTVDISDLSLQAQGAEAPQHVCVNS